MPALPFVTIKALPDPAGGPPGPAVAGDDHRVVAVATSAEELLRPDSDLRRLLAGVPQADLLLAADEPRLRLVRVPPPGPVEIDDLPPLELDRHAIEPDPSPDPVRLTDLSLPGVRVHRLDLLLPLTGRAEDDLVAGLSELIGFDPEPGLVCLAPTPVDPDGDVVSRAAERVAQVYGLPLRRFRCGALCAAGTPS